MSRASSARRRWRPISIALALFAALLFSPASEAMIGDKDWIDSPFTGQGVPPPGVQTTIFMSTYLDRLIYVDDRKYLYSVTMYLHLSWTDPRAFAAVANATARMNEKSSVGQGGTGCDRLCHGQEMRSELSQCCDTLFLPSIVFRNIERIPQDRVQPYSIKARENGVVTWRVEIRAEVYTSMIFTGFPFDSQTLDLHASMTAGPFPNNASLAVKSSATGNKLYIQGVGDDLSSWRVTDLRVYVIKEPWIKQFDDPEGMRNLLHPSDPADPAPLVAQDAAARAALEREYSQVLRITISIFISRLSLFFALQSILPVALCTLLSLTCFFLGASRVETRLELTFSLFLTLAAIQFVITEDMPKTSAVLPSQVLVLFSYSCLFAVAAESLLVYHVERFPELRAEWRRRAAAREGARRALSRAVSRSGTRLVKSVSSLGRVGGRSGKKPLLVTPFSKDDKANNAAEGGCETSTAGAAAAAAAPPRAAASSSASSPSASTASAAAARRELRRLRSPRFSSDLERGTGSAVGAEGSAAARDAAAAAAAAAAEDDSRGGARGDRRRGADNYQNSSSAAAAETAENEAAEASDRDRFAYAAWWIDRVSFWVLLAGYAAAAVLIFTLSAALAPGECSQFRQQSLVDECRLARRETEARRRLGGGAVVGSG